MRWLRTLLGHPSMHGRDLDDPRTTDARRRLIHSKPFLRQIYLEWYTALARAVPPGDRAVLEIGSGPGFLGQFIPGLITSDVHRSTNVRVVLDASQLPFADGTLKAIVMTNVLHHLSHPRQFFADAARCVQPGGAVVMIEPWVSDWSRLIYGRLHHEPFDPEAAAWERPRGGPLSGANGALPWILFVRDRARFEDEFQEWEIKTIAPGVPFRYLLSGGVSLRSLMPSLTLPLWTRLERVMTPRMARWAMFAEIKLVRRPRAS